MVSSHISYMECIAQRVGGSSVHKAYVLCIFRLILMLTGVLLGPNRIRLFSGKVRFCVERGEYYVTP